MEDKHRAIIRSNLVRFGKDLQFENDMVNYLVQFKILTSNDQETLDAKVKRSDKANWLMMNIDKKGPWAFPVFYKSLMETSQEPLADLLKPELAAERLEKEKKEMEAKFKQLEPTIISQPEQPSNVSQQAPDEPDLKDDLPTKWPIPDRDPSDIKITQVTSDAIKKIHADTNFCHYYKMHSKPYKGRAIIINNYEFKKDGKVIDYMTRDGTQIDGSTMSELLKGLKYDVVQHDDKTAKEMNEILKIESQNKEHWEYDSFILVIMSHGTTGDQLRGVDYPNTIQLADITEKFNGEKCEALAGKPKMFFIQACKGEEKDKGRVYPAQGVDSTDGGNIVTSPADDSRDGVEAVTTGVSGLHVTDAGTIAECPGDHTMAVTQGALQTKREDAPIPRDADIIIITATTPGMVSYRNTMKGSWFLQAVIYVFSTLAHKEHLSDLLVKVNALVSRSEDRFGYMQVSSTTWNTLTKKLYFYPGLEKEN